MSWGRYSGYFFIVYENNQKWTVGPFATRALADDEWMNQTAKKGRKAGKVFQRERPVYL